MSLSSSFNPSPTGAENQNAAPATAPGSAEVGNPEVGNPETGNPETGVADVGTVEIETAGSTSAAAAYLPGVAVARAQPESASESARELLVPELLVPEPPRAHAATNPLLAMLVGALLSCALIGGGILIGRQSVGAGGALATTGGDGSASIVQAVKAIGPAVMNVDTTFGKRDTKKTGFLPAPGSRDDEPPEGGKGKGTGFIIDSKRGLMLTNAHVVADAEDVQVTTRDGRVIKGKVRGFDRQSDIAVVVVDDKTLPQAKLADFKDPKDLDIGQWTIAIGNPYGQENTVTVGVLSAVGRTLPVPPNAGRDAFELTDLLQTDTPINPGNSGGPLCNARGEVIGINTAIIPFGQGLGFTIPINKAKRIADQIIAKGKVTRPWAGVGLRPLNNSNRGDYGLLDTNGGIVQYAQPNSPAAKAGLQAGDVIRKLNGVTMKSDKEIVAAIEKAKVGDTLKMEILRNGANTSVEIKVAEKPQ